MSKSSYQEYRDRVMAMAPVRDTSAREDCRHCRDEGKACGRAHFDSIAYSWKIGGERPGRVVTAVERSGYRQERPARKTATAARKASDKQVQFIIKLMGDKDLTGTRYLETMESEVAHFTSVQASQAIDELKALPRKPWDNTAGQVVTQDGWYLHNGTVYKVQRAVHGSGNLYAKELVIVDGSGSWEYAPGAVRKLAASEKMTLEQAAQYGRLYGVCIVCGATLTNEASIEAGIGPICASKF